MPQFFVSNGGDEVPLVEALLAPVRVEAASPSKGSGAPSFHVVSHRWSVVADSSLGEDVGGDSIGRHLREFTLGIRRVKAVCVAVGVERGKQAVLVLSSGSGSGPSESGVVARFTDAMHAAIRAFAETDFASYLRLGELGLANICQLCSENEEVVPDDDVEGSM
ncbi:unnamed protein product [Lactuca virosa]|uniref:Uncharacterized protein n=1 Tax=Lactuca virosa TaxID=75947 RepID=A0AAU9LNN4_9ASTR|nr:unnamed protein product [Lactuca virosa]